MITLLALTHDVQVAKRARTGALLEGVEGDAEKFGPLKIVLEAILALYANHEVRLNPYSTSPFDERISRKSSL